MDLSETICPCMGVTVGDIKTAVDNGAKTVEDIQNATTAGLSCGRCLDDIANLLAELTK